MPSLLAANEMLMLDGPRMPGYRTVHSITVDPICWDEFAREIGAHAAVRLMERQQFRSESEANRKLEQLMALLSLKQSLAECEEEERMDEARGLVRDALQLRDEQAKVETARKALERWEMCAEAYLLLSQFETDNAKRIEFLERAMEVALKQFDNSRFAEEGFLWQKLSTHSYMRSRAALALTLWEQGEKFAAIGHFKTMLQLNPADNQGLRLHLLSWLLDFDASDRSIDEYFLTYEAESSAFGVYAHALWKFVRLGDTRAAREALAKALAANKFVPAMLFGTAEVPNYTVKRVVRGSAPEAAAYCSLSKNCWYKTEGALTWLEQNCGALKSSKNILRQIKTAQEWKQDGPWAGRVPMELKIGNRTEWIG